MTVMKSLLLMAAIFAGVMPASAGSVDVTEITVMVFTGQSTIGWDVQAPQLSRPFPFDSYHNFFGSGIAGVPSITCSAPCGAGSHLTVDLEISGLTLGTGFANSIFFDNVLYPTVYLSGTLDIATRPFVWGQSQVPVEMSGMFTACADPACQTPLFPMTVDLLGLAYMNITLDQSGQPVLNYALFAAPEPGSAGLMFSGCLLIAGLVCVSKKQSRRRSFGFLQSQGLNC